MPRMHHSIIFQSFLREKTLYFHQNQNKNENTNKDTKDLENEGIEVAEKKPVSRYYKTKWEAEKHRRSGERIYREAGKGYYIRRPVKKRKKWWE